MNKKHLTQVWQWASVVCLLYLVTSIISLQGGSEFLGRLFGDKGGEITNRPAVGYFGVIVGAGLLLLASCSLLLHALRHGDCWHSRIPVVWLEGLDTSAWESKFYQGVVLLLFVALPAIGVLRCLSEAENGDICEHEASAVYLGKDTTLVWPPTPKKPGEQMRLRSAGSGTAPCDGGIELFPRSLTPLLMYGLPLLSALVALAAVAVVLFRRVPARSQGPAPERGDTTG